MKIEPRVYEFATSLRWTHGKLGELSLQGDRALTVACPKEFGGPGGEWTPEHLFVASVEVCIMTTFLWLLAREGVSIVSYRSDAKGEAAMSGGEFRFTRIEVSPHVVCPRHDGVQRIRKLLERAHRECLISKSLKFDVVLSPTLEVKNESEPR